MLATYLPSLVLVVVAVITVVGTWVNNRNDRALADQEIEILKKLDPKSEEAKRLQRVISRRIQRWHAKSNPRRRALGFGLFLIFIGYGFLILSVALDNNPRNYYRSAQFLVTLPQIAGFVCSGFGLIFYIFSFIPLFRRAAHNFWPNKFADPTEGRVARKQVRLAREAEDD